MEITYENIKDRPINMVKVNLFFEDGCDATEGEYSMTIAGLLGYLDISSIGGVDDVTLIKECIENDFNFELLDGEGMVHIYLEESGEWEDVFWHKYYVIKRFNIMEH